MNRIIFAFALMLLGSAAFSQNTSTLISNYINIKNALVKSDEKKAAAAIKVFYQSIKDDKDFPEKANLLKVTEKLATAGDLKSQREAFNDVSKAVWEVVKDIEALGQPLYYQYCPMKKGYWLSTEKKIENPYYGSSMLDCGKVVKTKK